MDLMAKELVQYPDEIGHAYNFVRDKLRNTNIFQRATVIRRTVHDRGDDDMTAVVVWAGVPMDVLGNGKISLVHVVLSDILVRGNKLKGANNAKEFIDNLINDATITLDMPTAKKDYLSKCELLVEIIS